MLAACSSTCTRCSSPGAREPSGWRRMPAVAGEAMVATSHPLATRAGLRALERGGNAVDAALAAAAVLTVAEPADNGVGGDAFALVWDGGACTGSTARAGLRRRSTAGSRPRTGPRSVTVPGAVRLWADLAERFGTARARRGGRAAADLAAARGRLHAARRGQVGAGASGALAGARPSGERYRLPELAATLRRIAEEGPAALYEGEVAAAIAVGLLALGGRSRSRTGRSGSSRCAARTAGSRCASCRRTGRASRRCSRSRSTTGLEPGLHSEIEAMKLAFADAYARRARRAAARRLLRRRAPRRPPRARPAGSARSTSSPRCPAAARRTSAPSTATGRPSR